MASCLSKLEFTSEYDKTLQELVIEVPFVYPCTDIEVKWFDEFNQVIKDWESIATLIALTTRIKHLITESVCRIEVRLTQCCTDCPPGFQRDPATGQCVNEEPECPPCEGAPVPELKSTIYGYAFYLDSRREVFIPKIEKYLPVRCAGGHRCNRATFMPRLRTEDGATIAASNRISLDNLPDFPAYTAPIAPVPNNVLGEYERSDSFTFTVNDTSLLDNSTNVILACDETGPCHDSITMIFLVGQRADNDEYVLIFSSCVAPGKLDKNFLGDSECTTPCEEINPPAPLPSPPPGFPDDPDDPTQPGPPAPEPPAPDDSPCVAIADSFEEECSELVEVSNPYIKPDDSALTYSTSDLSIPKKVILTISQTSCTDISAQLCTVRCALPGSPPDTGFCFYDFKPSVDVYDLPQILTTTPNNKPIDIDILCRDYTVRRPSFLAPTYTKIEGYFYPARMPYATCPCINGVIYDTTNLNINTKVKIHTATDSTSFRFWFPQNFAFVTLSTDKTRILRFWPYTDLFWYPFDSFDPDNTSFTPEPETVYVDVVPC